MNDTCPVKTVLLKLVRFAGCFASCLCWFSEASVEYDDTTPRISMSFAYFHREWFFGKHNLD